MQLPERLDEQSAALKSKTGFEPVRVALTSYT